MIEGTNVPQINNPPEIKPQGVKNRMSFFSIAIILLAVIIVGFSIWLVAYYFNNQKTASDTPATSTQTVSEIKTDADLKKIEDDVNKMDIDSMNSELDKIDTDAAGF
jgi:cytoskeletal protein RodZ